MNFKNPNNQEYNHILANKSSLIVCEDLSNKNIKNQIKKTEELKQEMMLRGLKSLQSHSIDFNAPQNSKKTMF